MSYVLLRWGLVVLLACLLAPTALAADRALRSRASGVKLTRLHGGHRLRHDAAAAFLRMSTSARREGIRLWITSGYRSRGEQHLLYQRYRKGLGPKAARPGRSNHQRGLAVDLVVGDLTSPTYDWLAANACRFGFKRTVTSEPWHWEYRPRALRPPAPGQDCLGRPRASADAPLPTTGSDPS